MLTANATYFSPGSGQSGDCAKVFYSRIGNAASVRGLCHTCLASNVEVVIDGSEPICRACLESKAR